MDSEYAFRFDAKATVVLRLFGINAERSWVRLTDDTLEVRFGPWRVRTPLANVAGVQRSGPFTLWRAFGVRLSLADRGLTFGTSTEGGVCVRFHRPVSGLLPGRLPLHPGLTVTVTDPEALMTDLRER
jgi:hypothetical protein